MKDAAFTVVKKLIGISLLVIVLMGLVIFGVPWWLSSNQSLEKADAIVAISGGDTEARTNEAIRLQKEGWASHLIFSGAAKDLSGPSNAEVMRRAALEAGVKSNLIDVEELSQNTFGNAKGTARIIQERGYKKVILVTSKYHQRRAGLEFQRLLGQEVRVINHSAPHDRNWPTKSWWLHPDSLMLSLVETVKTTYVWTDYRINK